jgi:hypothetical protein
MLVEPLAADPCLMADHVDIGAGLVAAENQHTPDPPL